MIVIENNNLDPAYNHALEEYLFNNYEDDIFIIWRNKPCILLGRNQNIYKEVNIDYCIENNMDIVRRLSGGGTIYCDKEIIQYTFITKEREGNSFAYFTKPIIDSLAKLGLNGEFTGRNDLIIDGKKFSGNAQYHNGGKVLHHGSILYGGNMENMKNALRPNPLKFVGKNVNSVAARVGMLKDEMDLSVTEFMDHITETVLEDFNIKEITKINEVMESEVQKIRTERFASDSWNYGKSPSCGIKHSVKHDFGIVEYGIDLAGGVINDIIINGDFFGKDDIKKFSSRLIGLKFTEKDFREALYTNKISDYIDGMTTEVFIGDIFNREEIEKNKLIIEDSSCN
ncbi:lipoate--protein ligase [Miniphocaeibacter massiliensis]|uniref:lipoate--protein ligase n=1 Tax=Miniphocaeibacter massiliensis TaxID=2041841 RepID=UPI000C1BA6F5|nr:lipoate--protein ligase [Miniphocaeibacter massiliensis]